MEINLKMSQIHKRNNKFNSHNNNSKDNLNLLLLLNKNLLKFHKSLQSLLQMYQNKLKHLHKEKLIFLVHDQTINKDMNKKKKNNNNIVHKKIQ